MHLGLAEWTVLTVICDRPTHGFAVAALTAPDGALGQVWHIPRPVVYRALGRLTGAGLVVDDVVESGPGPQRTRFAATAAGARRADEWLHTPVRHVRELRSELLMKLALLDRRGADPAKLIAAQRVVLDDIVAGLQAAPVPDGFAAILHAWRLSTAQAARQFLDQRVASLR